MDLDLTYSHSPSHFHHCFFRYFALLLSYVSVSSSELLHTQLTAIDILNREERRGQGWPGTNAQARPVVSEAATHGREKEDSRSIVSPTGWWRYLNKLLDSEQCTWNTTKKLTCSESHSQELQTTAHRHITASLQCVYLRGPS
jgi:hypothetical protein